MVHLHKFAGHLGIECMLRTLQQTCYWPKIAAVVMLTVQDCVQCARNRIRLHCIEREKLAELIFTNRFCLAPRLCNMPHVAPEAATPEDLDQTRTGGTAWVFHGILNPRLCSDGNLEFQSD